MNDFRLALRALRSTPIVSSVAIASLVLGIGATTAIFSLVNSLTLRSLPVSDPGQLAFVGDRARESRGWSNPIWEQIRSRPELFNGALAWGRDRFNLTRGGEAQYVDGIWASGDFFSVLGVPAKLGRTFTPDDDRRGGGPDGPVAVISHDFWGRHFGGGKDVIGKPLLLNSVQFTVVGVAPQGFFGPDVGQTFDVVVPIGTEPLVAGNNSGLDLRGRTWLTILVRRHSSQTFDSATARLRAVQQEIRDSLPLPDPRLAQDLQEPFALTPAATGRSSLRSRYEQSLVMLLTVSVGVLLIACVNIANLLIARAVVRRREMSLRVALGASRTRLARLLLVEATMLSAIGALFGVVLSQWMSRLLVRLISTQDNAVFFDLAPDWRVWSFAAAAALVTAVLFGVAPAWQSMRADPIEALREQGRGTVGTGRSRLSTTLVCAQLALSLVLVVAAGLFTRTATELAQRHVGSTKNRILLVNVTAPMTRYTLEQLTGTYQRVLDAIGTVPGVERAAISDITPAGGSARTNVIDLQDGGRLPERERLISVNVISPGWLQTYGVRLLAGRDFAPADRPQTQQVALVNEAFARRFFDGGNPVGRSVGVGSPGKTSSVEIVGLVEDTIYRSLRESSTPTLYTPTTQRAAARPYVNVAVLTAQGPPELLSRSVIAAVREVDPELVLRFRPLDEQVSAAMSQERLVALLAGFFGALALLLAGLGLYGVTAYSVSRRRGEIAMRVTLGATGVSVLTLVMRRIAIMVAAGIFCGAVLSFWAAQFVDTLVWGLEARDPVTFVMAALTLATAAGLAGALPAWHASRINPAQVLKET